MPNGLKLGILAIFVVICLSNSPLSISFAEEEKVKWIIEDQHITSEFDDSDTSNFFKSVFDGKNSDKNKSESS